VIDVAEPRMGVAICSMLYARPSTKASDVMIADAAVSSELAIVDAIV